jgi:hypothetical protein
MVKNELFPYVNRTKPLGGHQSTNQLSTRQKPSSSYRCGDPLLPLLCQRSLDRRAQFADKTL